MKLDISKVSPETGPQFSPNLHAWLKKNFGKTKAFGEPEVFRLTKDGFMSCKGALFIGYVFDGELCGSRLSTILCRGSRAQVFCFGSLKSWFEPVPNFWPKYLTIGRCHIDPDHKMDFTDTRWKEGPRRRTCLWCGLVQKKVTKRRLVLEKVWVAA